MKIIELKMVPQATNLFNRPEGEEELTVMFLGLNEAIAVLQSSHKPLQRVDNTHSNNNNNFPTINTYKTHFIMHTHTHTHRYMHNSSRCITKGQVLYPEAYVL